MSLKENFNMYTVVYEARCCCFCSDDACKHNVTSTSKTCIVIEESLTLFFFLLLFALKCIHLISLLSTYVPHIFVSRWCVCMFHGWFKVCRARKCLCSVSETIFQCSYMFSSRVQNRLSPFLPGSAFLLLLLFFVSLFSCFSLVHLIQSVKLTQFFFFASQDNSLPSLKGSPARNGIVCGFFVHYLPSISLRCCFCCCFSFASYVNRVCWSFRKTNQ